ncbi:MAG: ABC transporter permease subunit [Sphaerochaetaceae bacterium]|jgi:putative aldouronate transport system permease protein|nr:ABC transporter permease subunit [Sphaerochaetaceae bacterium]
MRNREKLLPKRKSLFREFASEKWIYFLAIPGIIYFFVFKYMPMYGMTVAFKDFSSRLGIMGSPWVGFKHFTRLFNSPDFLNLVRNTLILNVYRIGVMTPLAIIFALSLNEIGNLRFKKVIQTISYFPHFLSWVVVAGVAYQLFAPYSGSISKAIIEAGGEPLKILTSPKTFRSLIVITGAWKELGWASIIYLAAITGINPELYEAAEIDGASRPQQIWHITIPGILPTMVTLLLIEIGRIMSIGFEQVYVFLNPLLFEVGDVFSTYIYRLGLGQGRFSYTTAVGLFNTLIGFLLLVGANKLSKRITEESLW